MTQELIERKAEMMKVFLEGVQVGELWALTGRDPTPEYREATASRAIDRALLRASAAQGAG